MMDEDEEEEDLLPQIDGSEPETTKESARELARLRYNGELDTFLGVDMFWSEKWLLLLSCVQDFALLWLFPLQWPWHFWRRTHFTLYAALDFNTIRDYEIPKCLNCTIETSNCQLVGSTCQPILSEPSTLGSGIYTVLGAALFVLWLGLQLVPDLGLLGPALARNVERIACPLLCFFYLPVLLKTMYLVCDYKAFVVEKWECEPSLLGMLWSLPALLFVIGLPWVLVRRIRFQTLYKTTLRHETYIRTRELEYMLKLSTLFRDKRLWLMSSFTRGGRFLLPWYLIQKLLMVLLICVSNVHAVKTSDAKYQVAGICVAVYSLPTLLYTFFLRCYRVTSSDWGQLLLCWSLTFYATWGFITLCGARLVTEKEQGQAMESILLIVFVLYVVGMACMYYVSHDFSVLMQPGGAIMRERAKSIYLTKMREENRKHLHLGKSLKGMIVDLCREKLIKGRSASYKPLAGGSNSVIVVAKVTLPFEEETFISDFMLFGETSLAGNDIVIGSVVFEEDLAVVKLVLSSNTVDTKAVAADVCNRCAEGGLLKEVLNVVSMYVEDNILNEVIVDCEMLLLHFKQVFEFEGQQVLVSQKVRDLPEVAVVENFISRRVTAVGSVPVTDEALLMEVLQRSLHAEDENDGGSGEGDEAKKNDVTLHFAPEEFIPVPEGQVSPTSGPCSDKNPLSINKGDYELEMLQSLLKHRLTQQELFSSAEGEEDEQLLPTYSIIPQSSSVRYMWPVSQALVGEIKRENQTNRFLDVLRDANAMLMEVSFLHATPELIRIESLLFHIQRVTRCYHACQKLRVTHHLNAIHPLAPTFESTLEQLIHEYRVHSPRSLTVGKRAFTLPVVSAFLHHRMNRRTRFFALIDPKMLRVLFKLLVLRMFIQLVSKKEELLPAKVEECEEEEEEELIEQSPEDFAAEALFAVSRKGTFFGRAEADSFQVSEVVEVDEVVITENFVKKIENMTSGENIYRGRLDQEEGTKRQEVWKENTGIIRAQREKECKHLAKQAAARQACETEETQQRAKTTKEENVEWKAWTELSEDLLKGVRLQQKWYTSNMALFSKETAAREAIAEEEIADISPVSEQMASCFEQISLEERKLQEMKAAMVKKQEESTPVQAAAQLGADLELDKKRRKRALAKQLNEWKEKYTAKHGNNPTKATLASDSSIAKVYKEYQYLKSPRASPVNDPLPKKSKKERKAKETTPRSSQETTPLTLPATSPSGIEAEAEVVAVAEQGTPPDEQPQKETKTEPNSKQEAVGAVEAEPKNEKADAVLEAPEITPEASPEMSLVETVPHSEAHKRSEETSLEMKEEQQNTEMKAQEAPVADVPDVPSPEAESPKVTEVKVQEAPVADVPDVPSPKTESRKVTEVKVQEASVADVPNVPSPKAESPEVKVSPVASLSSPVESPKVESPLESPSVEEKGAGQEEKVLSQIENVAVAESPKAENPVVKSPVGSTMLSIEQDTSKTASGQDTDTGSAKPRKEKKKKARKSELVKQLNDWKAAFKEKHGKEPTKNVLKSDPDIAEVYGEYLALQKDKAKSKSPEVKPSEPSVPSVPSLDPKNYEEMPLSELKALVKSLVGKLNAWKEDFASKHEGTQPTKVDIRKSDDIRDTYEDYTKASSVLKRRKAS